MEYIVNMPEVYMDRKKTIVFLLEQYKKSKTKLLLCNYDSRLCDVSKAMQYDSNYIAFIDMIFSQCSKETTDFLKNFYVSSDGKNGFYKSMPKSTLYRLNKKAINEFANCLKH